MPENRSHQIALELAACHDSSTTIGMVGNSLAAELVQRAGIRDVVILVFDGEISVSAQAY